VEPKVTAFNLGFARDEVRQRARTRLRLLFPSAVLRRARPVCHDHVAMNAPEHARELFAFYRGHAPDPPARVLEIGPGPNTAVGRMFVRDGYDLVAIDRFRWYEHTESLERLYRELGLDGLELPVLEGSAEAMPLESGSIDYAYSNAACEHFRRPRRALEEMHRVLRTGGASLHTIDLRDHTYDHDPLRFLAYPDWAWWLINSPSDNYLNRWRLSDWEAGARRFFEVRVLATSVVDPALSVQRVRLASRFRDKSDLDLRTIACKVLLLKAG
jgi:SAM-dependent methyltransferase